MKRIALFFGSFNPIHFGHLNVAKAAIQTGIIEVDFIVSPKTLLNEMLIYSRNGNV